jgi:soluble lytic murein transglycosylase-like protein
MKHAAAFLAFLVLAMPATALAGAQDYEKLSASVRASMAKSVNEFAPINPDDLDMRAWVRAMTKRVLTRFEDEAGARQFLAMVHYESSRAGLDPTLVLAIIDVESKFRRYAVSKAGALGYMQVMPFWVSLIGVPSDNLFQPRTNLRYGCVIFRHYLDTEKGNVERALARYNGSLGKPDYPMRVVKARKEKWTVGA